MVKGILLLCALKPAFVKSYHKYDWIWENLKNVILGLFHVIDPLLWFVYKAYQMLMNTWIVLKGPISPILQADSHL